MLAGAKQTEALRGQLFRQTPNHVYACAIGAACYAADPELARRYGQKPLDLQGPADLFPDLQRYVPIPDFMFVDVTGLPDEKDEEDWPRMRLDRLIVDLNDEEEWSRPRIARLVEKLGY
jgi:hypothetical protein